MPTRNSPSRLPLAPGVSAEELVEDALLLVLALALLVRLVVLEELRRRLRVEPVALLLGGLAGHLPQELLVVVARARHVAVLALEDLVELAAVEEHATALAAGV